MMPMLSELLQGVSGLQSEVPSVHISKMTLDSREVRAGDLFVAMNGTQEHGLKYALKAQQLGAVAVVWDYVADIELPDLSIPLIAIKDLPASLGDIAARLYQHPSQSLQVVGITGTDGKTSVSHFLAQAMNMSDRACSVIGTLGIGKPNALEKASHTTPDVISVHKSLQHLGQQGSRCVAMEVSSHALDQKRVAAVDFDVAVLTNLTRDHLDYHGTVEAYAEAKARLFLEYSPKFAVLNLDDVFGKRLAEQIDQGKTQIYGYTLGLTGEGHSLQTLVATNAHYDHHGLSADISWQGQVYHLQAAVLGEFNLSNLLATMASLLALDYSPEAAIAALAKVATVPGRIEKVACQGVEPNFLSVVDYAHTPGALASVLGALRAHCSAKIICVFGCGGDRDTGKRPLMAAIAERLADQVIVTDDNPRGEDPTAIMKDIIAGFEQPSAVLIEHDRATAIRLALQNAQAGDVVLVAGKGHEQVQIIQGVEYPFDDREQIRQALADMHKESHV